MKWLLLSLTFAVAVNLSSQSIGRQQLRQSFLDAAQRKSALDSFIQKLEKISAKTPAEECYYGICTALSIQYTTGNWAKIKLVYEARNILNDAVAREPNDPELHFMRFTFEHFLPAFLGLSKDITTDLAAVLSCPAFAADNLALRKKALEFLIASKRCNAQQNQILNTQLADLNKTEFMKSAVTSIQ